MYETDRRTEIKNSSSPSGNLGLERKFNSTNPLSLTDNLQRSIHKSFGNLVSTKIVIGKSDEDVSKECISEPVVLSISTGDGEMDPLFIDDGCARLNCQFDSDSRIHCSLLSWNRQVVSTFILETEQQIFPLVQDLVSRVRFRPCRGFDQINSHQLMDLFARLRRPDLAAVLIEKHGQLVIFRARTCRFVLDGNECKPEDLSGPSWFHGRCDNCQRLCVDLDQRYAKGNFLKSLERQEAGDEKENCTQVVGTVEQRPDVRASSQEAALTDNAPSHSVADVDDFPPRRSSRISNKLTAAEHSSEKPERRRKRGRPPALPGSLSCSECEKDFSLQKDFRRHMAEHANRFPCNQEGCDRRFKMQAQLDIHTRKHMGEKPYVCSICEDAFELRHDLKLHMKSHAGYKPHECPVCHKGFSRKQQLQVHMTVHTGEKSYLCAECGNAFYSASTLIDHKKRKHLEMKSHKCRVCPKSFFAKQELESHMTTHTGDKPFNCGECNRSFSRPHHLKRHARFVHGRGHRFASESVVLESDRGGGLPEDKDDVAVLQLGGNGEFVVEEEEEETGGIVVEDSACLALEEEDCQARVFLHNDVLTLTESDSSHHYAALTGASSLLELSQGVGETLAEIPIEGGDVITVRNDQIIQVEEDGQVVLVSVQERLH